MIKVKVLLFSTIRSVIGQKELVIELPLGSTVLDLKQRLAQIYPQAEQPLEFMLASVDRVFSKDDTILSDQAEVGFFPHISGG
jgi:molybdopterin converting factor small subunit